MRNMSMLVGVVLSIALPLSTAAVVGPLTARDDPMWNVHPESRLAATVAIGGCRSVVWQGLGGGLELACRCNDPDGSWDFETVIPSSGTMPDGVPPPIAGTPLALTSWTTGENGDDDYARRLMMFYVAADEEEYKLYGMWTTDSESGTGRKWQQYRGGELGVVADPKAQISAARASFNATSHYDETLLVVFVAEDNRVGAVKMNRTHPLTETTLRPSIRGGLSPGAGISLASSRMYFEDTGYISANTYGDFRLFVETGESRYLAWSIISGPEEAIEFGNVDISTWHTSDFNQSFPSENNASFQKEIGDGEGGRSDLAATSHFMLEGITVYHNVIQLTPAGKMRAVAQIMPAAVFGDTITFATPGADIEGRTSAIASAGNFVFALVPEDGMVFAFDDQNEPGLVGSFDVGGY